MEAHFYALIFREFTLDTCAPAFNINECLCIMVHNYSL
jgi:hypothetical protein